MRIRITMKITETEKKPLSVVYSNLDNSIPNMNERIDKSFLEQRSNFTESVIKKQLDKIKNLKVENLDVYVEKELPKYISNTMEQLNFKSIINLVIETSLPKNTKKIPTSFKPLDELGFSKYKIEQI